MFPVFAFQMHAICQIIYNRTLMTLLLSLSRHRQMRPLQRKRQVLLRKRLVIVRGAHRLRETDTLLRRVGSLLVVFAGTLWTGDDVCFLGDAVAGLHAGEADCFTEFMSVHLTTMPERILRVWTFLTIRNIIIPRLLFHRPSTQRRMPRGPQMRRKMRMFPPLHPTTLLRLPTRNTRIPLTLPTETLPSTDTQPAIPPTRHSTRRPRAHGAVLRLEGFPPPCLGEGEGLEFLFVLFLRWLAVFRAGHGFAGSVDVGGPAFLRGGFAEGGGFVRGLGGFGLEEGSGFFADRHGDRRSRKIGG